MPIFIKKRLSLQVILSGLLMISSCYVSGQTTQTVPLTPVTPTVAPQPTVVTAPMATAAKPFIIVVDAGHGGKDGSTRGLFSREKDVALAVALQLGQTIEKEIPNSKVMFTRTDDTFIPLYERIEIANRAHADLFISIHCNSMPSNMRGRTNVTGVETIVSGTGRLGEQEVAARENASILLEKGYKDNYEGFDPNDPESYIILSLMKSAYRVKSIKLASFIQKQYIKSGRVDRGVKEQSLAVLAKAGMPAVLTEIGFISNPEEEEFINSASGRDEIVQNIKSAIADYINSLVIK